VVGSASHPVCGSDCGRQMVDSLEPPEFDFSLFEEYCRRQQFMASKLIELSEEPDDDGRSAE